MTLTIPPMPSGAQVVLPAGASDADWHAVRATGLGGSDMTAVCGLDKYTSPLEIWYRKTGRDVHRHEDAVLSEAALMGHLLEPVVRRRFTDLTGLPVLDGPGTLRAIDPEWALANLDGIVLERGEYGVFEAKTRSSYALDEWLDEPPTGPYLQTQSYLMVTGWSFGYIACLVGGQRTIVHRVERDEELIAGLRAIGDEFWESVLSGSVPRADGSAATADFLARLHPTSSDTEVIADDANEVEALLQSYAKAKAAKAAAEAEQSAAENRLRQIAGDAGTVLVRGEKAYSLKPRKGSISWKSAALSLDPEIDPEPFRGNPTRVLTIYKEAA